MSVSEYRKQILARVEEHRSTVDREVDAILDLADSEQKLSELISVINDSGSTSEQKRAALLMLNAVSNFSSKARKLQPQIVNALRGQIDASDNGLRLSAISTLAALKDDIVQEHLLEELNSDKPEEEKTVPTVSALAMLGQDEKTLSTPLLRKIATAPPNEESRAEAVRQMSSDPEASEDLLSLMKDENVPLATREMIPGMLCEADPVEFLNAATEILRTSGAENELAPWLVKAAATIATPEASEAVASTKSVVEKLRTNASASFQSAASALLDKIETPDE